MEYYQSLEEEKKFEMKMYDGTKLRNQQINSILRLLLIGFPLRTKTNDPFERSSICQMLKEYLKEKYWHVIYDSYSQEIVSLLSVTTKRLYDGCDVYVGDIVTHPRYRNMGLMKTLIDDVKEKWGGGMWLYVNVENPAFKHYKKIGFKFYRYVEQEEESELTQIGENGECVAMFYK